MSEPRSQHVPTTTIVLATANPHKIDELRAIFVATARVIGLGDLPSHLSDGLSEPDETGGTFEANARLKALGYARQIGQRDSKEAPSLMDSGDRTFFLADDSGLEIDALNGAPGVISSHYATDGRETGLSRAERDAANNARVLRELNTIPPERRSARFVCVMTLANLSSEPKIAFTTRGTFEGRIGVPPRVPAGGYGFGYDPLFLVAPDFEHTSAELPPAEKNQRSHRAKAAGNVAAWLKS